MNADEHKKLLAQVAELEKNSVNYFDVEKKFFLIDSDNLLQVRSKLYGYLVQRSGIYEEDNLTSEAIAGLDGRGCYVYVEVKDGKITINQDFNGCWGIYLFRHGDYFALSNSFFRLLDHVKFKYPLTINRDYCHHLLVNDVSSHAYCETAVNEIQLVDRNAIIHIDTARKRLDLDFIDYQEHSVSLDSKEGIDILDDWLEFWSDVLNGVSQHTKFIQADLSGGFDTRVSMIPLFHSSIDCNKIKVHSAKSKAHTFEEDYEIATRIANHYGFKLHQPLPARQFLNCSLADTWNSDLYSQQSFHNMPKMHSKKDVQRIYYLKGYGGETIRGNWLRFASWEKFKAFQMEQIKPYSSRLSSELAKSIEHILKSASRIICDKYKIEDPSSRYVQQYIYQDTRTRHHHGKEIFNDFLRNTFTLFPSLDPAIRAIKLETSECPDPQLIIAFIFARYEPDLLTFPFQGKRSIAPETIAYAKKINERFPRRPKDTTATTGKKANFHLQPRDLQAEKILAEGKNNPSIPSGLPQACLKAMFESSRTYGLFTAYFDEELYRYASTYYEKRTFGRDRLMYSIVGVTRVLEDVEISQRNHSPYQDMQRFLEQDFATLHKDADNILNKFKRYFTARINIKLIATEGELEILSVSDDRANLLKPSWYQNGGTGYQIQSYAGQLNFIAKATVAGKISLYLRGLDIRYKDELSKCIPYWIDYTKLTVNGETIFNTLTPAWHNKPYTYSFETKADEEIKIQVEWQPHRSDT